MKLLHEYRRGFTLIELLVILAVIAMLIAIVMPVFSKVKARSRQTQCISNLHAIGQALAIYRIDFKGYPPRNNTNYNSVNGFLALADPDIYRPNPPYLNDKKAFICPSDDNGSTVRDAVEEKYSSYSYDPNYPGLFTSLTYNKDVGGNTPAALCPKSRHGVVIELKVNGEVILNRE
ncbi:MAG: type II secretion system protein [bacterium]|mgnify:CR=1 FL=1|jgi:prepilin-type N-terminal cleavage/methylation domain-containing protein|nr:type II secretion system protein [bacterium]MDD3805844.1 type II secretion system protein [bacterium]MDD4152162.1 type II secretion system protein [bacterium]MDD4557875.1 type II secretion system protein [bacterium]